MTQIILYRSKQLTDSGQGSEARQGGMAARIETTRETRRIMAQQMGSGDIAELVRQMEQSEDDPRRCYAIVNERISAFKRSGHQVPDDLIKLERRLMTECMQASQGR